MIIQLPAFIQDHNQYNQWATDFVWYKFDLNALSAFALCIYSYDCVPFVFPVRKELDRPTEQRMQKVLFN